MLSPNGANMLDGIGEDAMAQLQAAGPRGAMLLGAAAGMLFGGWKGAVAGGLLGYFSGRYFVGIAAKTIAVATTVAKVTP
jgi:predicted lipid-binding transport protein (Tim44 family)